MDWRFKLRFGMTETSQFCGDLLTWPPQVKLFRQFVEVFDSLPLAAVIQRLWCYFFKDTVRYCKICSCSKHILVRYCKSQPDVKPYGDKWSNVPPILSYSWWLWKSRTFKDPSEHFRTEHMIFHDYQWLLDLIIFDLFCRFWSIKFREISTWSATALG